MTRPIGYPPRWPEPIPPDYQAPGDDREWDKHYDYRHGSRYPEGVRPVRRDPAVDMLAGPGWILSWAEAVAAGLVPE